MALVRHRIATVLHDLDPDLHQIGSGRDVSLLGLFFFLSHYFLILSFSLLIDGWVSNVIGFQTTFFVPFCKCVMNFLRLWYWVVWVVW